MPRTAEEQKAWNQQCYGCQPDELEAIIESSFVKDPLFIAISMLSDTQELIAINYTGDARQMINRAKWMMVRAQELQEIK